MEKNEGFGELTKQGSIGIAVQEEATPRTKKSSKMRACLTGPMKSRRYMCLSGVVKAGKS
jgi:hypothetical protein